MFGQTAEEAQDKLDALRAELKTTGSVAPKDLTVRHIMEDLLAHPPSSWKSPLTIRGNRDRAAHIIAGLGKAKLARLTVTQVERCLDDLAAEGMSSDTINRCRALLRLAIRRAERDGKIGRNVAALADPPSGTRRKSRAMTLAQVNTLLAEKLNTFWRGYITVGLTCGLSPGELLGLRWEDVDFDGGVIRVRKCLKALPDPKTGKRRLVLEDLKTEQRPAHDADAAPRRRGIAPSCARTRPGGSSRSARPTTCGTWGSCSPTVPGRRAGRRMSPATSR